MLGIGILSILGVIQLFTAFVSAHMIMNTPQGFPGIIDEVNPLDPPQFQFPCQAGPDGNYSYSTPTIATVGDTILVNFTGSAVHGGGTCQFSIAKYPPPADPKKWKVIHTILGGCPATAPLNLASIGEDAEQRLDGPHCSGTGGEYLNCVKSYNIPIPDGMPNGEFVLSWTWLNHLGNREIYQSCAPISIMGGDQSLNLSDLPSIFFANYYPSSVNCSTEEGVLLLPEDSYNASLSELSPYLPDAPQASAIGNCSSVYGVPTAVSIPSNYISLVEVSATGGLSAMTSSYVSIGSVSVLLISSSMSTSSTVNTSLQTTKVTTFTSFSTVVVQSTTYVSMNTSIPTIASKPASKTSSPYPGFIGAPGAMQGPSNVTVNGSGVFNNGTIRCNDVPDGTILCIGSIHFGICNFGFAVAMKLAAGTTCSNGTITKRSPKAFE